MAIRPSIAIFAGALAAAIAGMAAAMTGGGPFVDDLSDRARAMLQAEGLAGIEADFATPNGFPSRHPVLSGGETADEPTRARAALLVAGLPGAGGIRWIDGSAIAEQSARSFTPLHCQDDVEALLRARTIRFEELSSAMDRASLELLDEVAEALRPCLGSIIAITGHTDKSGPEPGNLALSAERADAVRDALRRRGIPGDGLRARGVGSRNPVDGLAPADPANRRIEFSVIATEPILPTPVDMPGAR